MKGLRMLLKMLLKCLLKLLFWGRAAAEVSADAMQKNANTVKKQLEQVEAGAPVPSIKESMGKLEQEINERIETFREKLALNTPEEPVEINELRAEVAELRAELRELKTRSSEAEGNPSD